MKRLLLLAFVALACAPRLFAQLPPGTVAPDWTETSITGSTYHLYDMLNQGKVVYIDFSATWCGPCWNYHNSHALRDLYLAHGPSGDNKARVFFIEGDGSTNTNCLYGPTGCVGGTQGNWVTGTPYPIIDDNDENTTSNYAIAYFPTIYGICPMNKQVYETGQLTATGLWNWSLNTCPAFQITSDPVVTNVQCFGQNNGKIVQTPTNGQGPYTYHWSNNATTKDLNNVAPGNYFLTITDANSNTGVLGPITVAGPTAALSATTIETTPVGCAGIMGSITIEGTGGTSDYAYAWQNGQTTQQAIGLAAGTWKCTVTDANGCTFLYQKTLAPAVYPTASIATPGQISCSAPTVTLNGSASSQGPDYTYQWQAVGGGNIVSGATTLNPVVNAGGTYILQVTNTANNCFSTAPTSVLANIAQPTANAGPAGSVTCANPSTTLTGTGSTGSNFTYLWTATGGGNISSGATTLTPTVNAAGGYNLLITNTSNGCTTVSSTSVTGNNTAPSLAVSGGTLTCTTTQIALGATSNGTNLTWNWTGPNGFTSTSQNPSVGTAGSYSLTINNPATGCTNTATTSVGADNLPPTVGATGGSLTCLASSVVLNSTSSATNSGFAWTGPNGFSSTSQNPTASEPGSYALLVTAPNGCTSSTTASVSLNNTPPTAEAGSNGLLNCNASQVTLSGIGSSLGADFLYSWTTSGGNIISGANTLTPTVDAAGTYNLLVTNTANGCTSADGATVTVNVAPTASIFDSQNVSCFGGTNGAAYVLPTGGGGSFTYLWSNGSSSNNISNAAAGTYSVVVTDADNCTASASVVLSQPQPLEANATATSQIQNGQNDGTATAQPTGGTANFQYLWSNGATTQSITGLAPGSYTVVVTDANGCSAVQTVTVNAVGCAIVATLSQQNAACFGEANGSATVNLTGAAQPVTYSWSNGQTSQTATGLSAGQYTVAVADANGCPATLSVNILEPTALASNATATAVTTQNGADGTAAASPTGGTAPFTYLWSNSFATQTIVGLAPGLYSVVVTDANGCTAAQTVVVGNYACALQPTVVASPVACFGGADGQATISLGGGIAPYTYSWSNGATTATASGLAAGQYFVSASDANGCPTVETVTIGQPAALDVSSKTVDVLCPADAQGEISLTTSGGTAGYTFLWSNGATTAEITGLTAGTYSAVVTDANGCTISKTATISSTDVVAPALVLKNITAAIDDNGLATIDPAAFDNGSTDNCSILKWSASQSSFDCSQLGPHTVIVTATDGSGNHSEMSAEVNVVDLKAPVLTCPASETTSFCHATVNYNYPIAVDNCTSLGGKWEQSTGLPSGTEFPIGKTVNTFTYTDASGNVGACSFEVVVLAAPAVDLAVVGISCPGANDGSATATPTGGYAPFTYLWSNGQTGQTATNLSGDVSLSVTDAGGCPTAIGPIFMPQPTAIAATATTLQNDIGGAGVGQIQLLVTGGTQPYTFSWTKDGVFFSNSMNLSGLNMGTYVCLVTDAHGCTFTKSFTILNTVGASEPGWASSLLVSPNPTTGEVAIDLPGAPDEELTVDLFDARGRLVSTTSFERGQSTIRLDYSKVPTGAYFISVRAASGVANRRLVIAR